MPNFPRRLVRLMTPPDCGTFQGQDGLVYPMADDRSIEVPDDYVPGLLARGYKLYEPPATSAQQRIAQPESYDPTAIAKLRAPKGASGVSAGRRTYAVAADGTVDVQVQDVAELLVAGCTYYGAPRGG